MSSPDDRPAPQGEPAAPRWDASPVGQGQPPAWDTPAVGQQGWGPPPAYAPGAYAPAGYAPAAQQTSGKAIAALVLAIGAWVVLPLVGAIVALVLASGARSEIVASGGRLGGDGLVTAAKWVSWLNIAFCGLLVLAVVAAFSLFASVGFS